MTRLLLTLVWLCVASAGYAPQAARAQTDPALEARVKAIAEELRCLVCQNQTIADSDADLARDLRAQIREKLKAGASEADIKKFMVERYGDFVLYRPPMTASTVLLWFGPFLLLAAGCATLFLALKRRKARPASATLSADEERRALELLNADSKP